MKQTVKVPDEEVLARLLRHAWPGNVRELRNLAERLAIVASGETIRVADLPPGMGGREMERSAVEFLEAPTFQEFKDRAEK